MLALLGGVALVAPQRQAVVLFVRSFSGAPAEAFTALAIVTWVGLVTTAFPTWAQSFGQATIDAGTATVIYTAQPLWAAVFGFALLGMGWETADACRMLRGRMRRGRLRKCWRQRTTLPTRPSSRRLERC